MRFYYQRTVGVRVVKVVNLRSHIPGHYKHKNEHIGRGHSTSTKMYNQKKTVRLFLKMWKFLSLYPLMLGIQNGTTASENTLALLKSLSAELSCDTVILLGRPPQEK